MNRRTALALTGAAAELFPGRRRRQRVTRLLDSEERDTYEELIAIERLALVTRG